MTRTPEPHGPLPVEAAPLAAWEEQSLRQKAAGLLSVAECVTREGWGEAVAAHLRQAAQDLLRLSEPGHRPG